MCQACEEIDLYFAYLEQQEANKRVAAQSAPTVELSAESSGADLPIAAAEARFTCEDPAIR